MPLLQRVTIEGKLETVVLFSEYSSDLLESETQGGACMGKEAACGRSVPEVCSERDACRAGKGKQEDSKSQSREEVSIFSECVLTTMSHGVCVRW